jgi:hypothetical protein
MFVSTIMGKTRVVVMDKILSYRVAPISVSAVSDHERSKMHLVACERSSVIRQKQMSTQVKLAELFNP